LIHIQTLLAEGRSQIEAVESMQGPVCSGVEKELEDSAAEAGWSVEMGEVLLVGLWVGWGNGVWVVDLDGSIGLCAEFPRAWMGHLVDIVPEISQGI
jgi:hypothetical protein